MTRTFENGRGKMNRSQLEPPATGNSCDRWIGRADFLGSRIIPGPVHRRARGAIGVSTLATVRRVFNSGIVAPARTGPARLETEAPTAASHLTAHGSR